MRTLVLLACMVVVSTAAIQQKVSPVYQPLPVINSGSAKSSSLTAVQSQPQPTAEERESSAFQQAEAVKTVAPSPSSPTQSYMVYYYPNHSQQPNRPEYSNSYPTTAAAPVDYWSLLRMNDIIVGSAVLALAAAGCTLIIMRMGGVKTRALRELRDLNAEDAAQLAKGVMRAVEKLYELNNSN